MLKNICVLFLIQKLDIGGAEKHLLQFLPRLQKLGLGVEIYTFENGGELYDHFCMADINIYTARRCKLQILDSAWIIFQILIHLYNNRPEVVHFFLPRAYIIGGLASLFIPGVIRIMSRRSLNYYQKKYPLTAFMESWLHKKMDAVLANSKAVVNQLEQEGVPDKKIFLLYNGVKIKHASTQDEKLNIRKELYINKDAFVIICIANLIEYKGHADLFKALSIIADDMPEKWLLLCIGRDDGIGDRLGNYIRELEIDSSVRFLGERTDIDNILACSDLGICASHQEGFSNAILEGMAAGLPMVVTDVGGNPEAVIEGKHGKVVPSHCPDKLGEAILELALDEKKRRKMGEAARQRVKDHFTIEQCLCAYEKLYESLSGGYLPPANSDSTININ